MTFELMATPFTVDALTRDVVTVTQGTDAETADAITGILHTRKGERGLAPGLGTSDPVNAPGVDLVGEIQACLTMFGPQATVTAGEASYSDDARTVTLPVFYSAQEAAS